MADQPKSGRSGYAVHPSFVEPIKLTPEMEIGITTALMGDWLERFTEEEQEAQLRVVWDAVCNWAESRDVDRVYVDSFPREYFDWLLAEGFTAPSEAMRSSAGLHYVGTPREVAQRMRRTFAVPTLFLSASTAGRELVRVEDLSWDSVFVYSDEPPVLLE